MIEQDDPSGQSDILQDAAKRFLADGPPQKAEVEIAASLLGKLNDLAASRGLTETEAIQMAIAAGLVSLEQGEVLLDGPPGGDDRAQVHERNRARLIELQGSYAVMKYRLWLALQDNKVMSLRDGAMIMTIKRLQKLVERLKGELAEARRGQGR